MSWELWLAFVVASTALLSVPGPTVMLVVSYALGRGKQTGWATVPGVTLGDFVAMTASLLGVGAILATSATAFTVMKFAGAAYLIWLGIMLWRADPRPDDLTDTRAGSSGGAMFWNAFVVTALNPKSIIFFIAFVPQFIDPSQPSLMQFVILEATFLVLAAVNVAIWAVLAGELRAHFRRASTLRMVNRIGAGILIGAGVLTAALRRAN